MVRILAAVAIVVFLVFYAEWKKENPDQPITASNATTERVAYGIVGDAAKTQNRAKAKIGTIQDQRGNRLKELDKF